MLGAVFNLGAAEGFYAWDKCAEMITRYFDLHVERRERYYGACWGVLEGQLRGCCARGRSWESPLSDAAFWAFLVRPGQRQSPEEAAAFSAAFRRCGSNDRSRMGALAQGRRRRHGRRRGPSSVERRVRVAPMCVAMAPAALEHMGVQRRSAETAVATGCWPCASSLLLRFACSAL